MLLCCHLPRMKENIGAEIIPPEATHLSSLCCVQFPNSFQKVLYNMCYETKVGSKESAVGNVAKKSRLKLRRAGLWKEKLRDHRQPPSMERFLQSISGLMMPPGVGKKTSKAQILTTCRPPAPQQQLLLGPKEDETVAPVAAASATLASQNLPPWGQIFTIMCHTCLGVPAPP